MEELVGGREGSFEVDGASFTRHDLQLVRFASFNSCGPICLQQRALTSDLQPSKPPASLCLCHLVPCGDLQRNAKGQRLECSHFKPVGVTGKDGKLPCVVYCHCNSGSRRDAEEALYVLLPQMVTVFTLDFTVSSPGTSLGHLPTRASGQIPHTVDPASLKGISQWLQGSGLSEGDWVTLGAHEADDLACVVKHLRDSGTTSTIGLWGRSMGAVTALLYSNRDPSIAGLVRALPRRASQPALGSRHAAPAAAVTACSSQPW